MKKQICCILALVILIMGLASCKSNVYPMSVTQIMMDTVVSIRIYNGNSDVLKGAVELCKHYEKLFSKTIETSDVYKLNTSNGVPVSVSSETIDLLATALTISNASNGAFDPTVLPLVSLWDVNNATAVPKDSDIKTALISVDYNNIVIDGNTVALKNGATIDLGGIAKGYIADKIKEYLISNGIKNAIINLGGNILLVGSNNGKDFSVGVQKPFGKENELVATIYLTDKTAVTSGIYQRYFKADGKVYHHILDTESGYPADNGISAVTVITDSSCIADGLSTACLNLGLEKGKELAKKYSAELIFITTDGEIILTDGLTQTTDKNDDILIYLK